MREPNKNFVYSLEELTSEEFKVLNEYLTNNEEAKWNYMTFNALKNVSFYTLYWCNDLGWCLDNVTKIPTHNAKELFYTLENIQVDLKGLTGEDIINISNIIYNKKGTRPTLTNNGYIIYNFQSNKTTITYNKFMELFGNKEECKDLAEETSVYDDMLSIIEKGKQQGLKVAITFERL